MRRTSASDHSLTCLKAYWLPRQSRGLIEELDLLWWEEFTGRALCLLATIAPPFDPLKSRDSEEHIGIWSSEGVEAIWLWHQRGFGGDNSISNARWPRNVLLKKEEQRSSLTLRVILPWVGSRVWWIRWVLTFSKVYTRYGRICLSHHGSLLELGVMTPVAIKVRDHFLRI